MQECIFCKIIEKKIPTELLYEDELVVAFADINPLAPVHVLVIPRQHIESVNHLEDGGESEKIAGRMMLVAKKIAQDKGIAEDGYKLLIRTGSNGGQEVPHIHLHLIGGARLSEGIRAL